MNYTFIHKLFNQCHYFYIQSIFIFTHHTTKIQIEKKELIAKSTQHANITKRGLQQVEDVHEQCFVHEMHYFIVL